MSPTLPPADFSISFEQAATGGSPATAEGWARAVFEGGPALLRSFVLVGWRFGLGLRLGPRPATEYVAGWRIVERSQSRVVLEAASYLISSRNLVELSDSKVVWTTEVTYVRLVAKPLWLLALPIHKVSIRYLLRRAAR